MPNTYNIALLGPNAAGKRTMANMLAKRYGWKIINLEEVLEAVVKK